MYLNSYAIFWQKRFVSPTNAGNDSYTSIKIAQQDEILPTCRTLNNKCIPRGSDKLIIMFDLDNDLAYI